MSVYGVLDATLSLRSCTTLGFKMSCYKQLYNPYDLGNQLYTEQTTVNTTQSKNLSIQHCSIEGYVAAEAFGSRVPFFQVWQLLGVACKHTVDTRFTFVHDISAAEKAQSAAATTNANQAH